MFLIKDTLVSQDLIERFFKCDLKECKGECCIEGDAGAPILEKEKEAIEKHLPDVLPLLTPQGRMAVENEGVAYIDSEGDLVTTLIDGGQCAFTTWGENGVCLCALEKGFREGKLPQLKPSSCHLYPVRLKDINGMTAVNLHRWKICRCAEKLGKKENMRAYKFLKEPLVRQFGPDWYEELEKVGDEWLKTDKNADPQDALA